MYWNWLLIATLQFLSSGKIEKGKFSWFDNTLRLIFYLFILTVAQLRGLPFEFLWWYMSRVTMTIYEFNFYVTYICDCSVVPLVNIIPRGLTPARQPVTKQQKVNMIRIGALFRRLHNVWKMMMMVTYSRFHHTVNYHKVIWLARLNLIEQSILFMYKKAVYFSRTYSCNFKYHRWHLYINSRYKKLWYHSKCVYKTFLWLFCRRALSSRVVYGRVCAESQVVHCTYLHYVNIDLATVLIETSFSW